MTPKYYSTAEAAKILHLSRVAVFNQIKLGKIKGEKIGRNYIIPHESVAEALGKIVGSHKRREIESAIEKALAEYSETFKKLGKE